MAATKIVNGVLRELWEETVAQGPGIEVITTNIRMNARQLSSVQGILALSHVSGVPVFSAALSVVGRKLVVTVANAGAPGASAAWILDVQLTHSSQQARRGGTGYILVTSGPSAAAVGLETLAQAYAAGTGSADQRMIVGDAQGGGVTVDASTANVTGDGVSLEVRQNDAHAVPLVISRRVGSAAGPNLSFDKARGTYAVPADVQDGDQLGVVDFYGRLGGQPVLGARVTGMAVATAGGLDGGIDLAASAAGALNLMARFDVRGPSTTPEMILYGNGYVLPSVNHQGHLGVAGNVWAQASIDYIDVYANIRMGGVPQGTNANLTIVLTNTATAPGDSVDIAHLYSADFGLTGAHLAALAIYAEMPVGSPDEAVGIQKMIPIIYNGQSYYLLATQQEPLPPS
jgi:hypothetical protein